MKNTLYFKFIMAYVILAVLGFMTISTVGSSMIQNRILNDEGESLYKEAISIASYQATADYTNTEDVEETYNYLKTLSNYQDSRIMILNFSGVTLIDTGLSYQ